MKKIISLVVMTAMLCTLFAVNVSAAVFTGDAEKAFYAVNTFDEVGDWQLKKQHGDAFDATLTIVEDAVKGNALEVKLTSAGHTYQSFVGIVEENAPAFPSKYEVSFAVKKTVDRNAAPIVWIGDPALASNGGFGVLIGLGTTKLTKDTWYEYKIAIDKSASPVYSVLRRTVGGTWEAALGGGWDTGRYLNSWQNNSTYGVYDSYRAGFAFTTQSGVSANGDSFLFDDFAVTEIATIPSTGVVLSQDFEDDSNTAFSNFQNSKGSGTIKTDASGNSYYEVKPGADTELRMLATTASSATSWTGTLSTVAGTTNVIEFDICAKSDDKAPVTVEFCSAGGAYSIFNLPALPQRDVWYTYKVTQTGPTGAASSASVVRKVKGTNDWTVVAKDSEFTFKSTANSGIKAEVCIGNTGNKIGSTVYWFDNITISSTVARSYLAEKDGNDLTVKFAYDKVKDMLQVADRAVALATFANGVLVDVDYQRVANDAGTVAAELEASALGADKAELYVWDYSTMKPVMTDVLNLTSYLQ